MLEKEVIENLSEAVIYCSKFKNDDGTTEISLVFPYNITPPSKFEGISMGRFTFFENKLDHFVFDYSEYKPSDINDFVTQASKTLNLPKSSWKYEYESATIVCKGFEVIIFTGVEGRKLNYPTIIFSDLEAEAKKERQIKEAKQKEELKKKVFKP